MDLTVARRVMERINLLSTISEEPDRLTRRFATPAMLQATSLVADWMRQAGMQVRTDNIGNLSGRYEASQPGAKTMLLGSHLDTVRDSGKFDGPLGVVVALAAVEELAARQIQLPFAIEIVAFADEEGLRYHSTYLGSSVLAGTFNQEWLTLTDASGISMAQAIRLAGGDPNRLAEDRRDPADLLGYCEVHIEQGPVLEQLDMPVGVVEAIAGQTRVNLTFKGEAGHAGTVPMALRHDALCAAATFVLVVESLARRTADLVATVGQIQVEPGASNVVPGLVTLSLDVRHPEDEHRQAACELLQEQAIALCADREIGVDWQLRQSTPAIHCASELTERLAQAIQAQTDQVPRLVSGAGHDAVVMASLTDVAMLFVRCERGISHNPAESVTTEDIAVAINTLVAFLTGEHHPL